MSTRFNFLLHYTAYITVKQFSYNEHFHRSK
jgi:hypothetical protein